MTAPAGLSLDRAQQSDRRVGVIGCGAIGRRVVEELAAGGVPGAVLTCVVDSRPVVSAPAPQVPIEEALRRCDILVECAGQPVVEQYGERILASGVDLLVTSVGALAAPGLAERLWAAGPGRLHLTSGAIGGLDLLAATRRGAAFDRVRVVTTKLPASLVQPWMTEAERARLLEVTGVVEVFAGGAREAARRFPRSLNVAAAVAVAVGGWDDVEIVLRADPAATLTSHVIEATGPLGRYRFEICNLPSADNPTTSGIVPLAVLRSLATLVGRPGPIV